MFVVVDGVIHKRQRTASAARQLGAGEDSLFARGADR